MALCLCHTAKSPFNFISHCSAVIALPTEIRRPEEVGEDASAKEIKSCFTKIALLFSCVFCGLGALGLFPNTAHTSVQVQQCLWGPGESPCREAGIAKAGKLNWSIEKPLGTTARKILVKGACISVSVPIMWV